MGLNMRKTRWILAAIAATSLLTGSASGQEPPAQAAQSYLMAQAHAPQSTRYPLRDEFVEKVNANTVTIVSGNPNGAYLYQAYDMSAVLDDGNKLRILPIIGKGGGQNVKDVLYLRGADMGITQSNVLRYYRQTGELGRNITDRLRYIARLNSEEMHLLVRSDINSIKDLKGKKVNFSEAGSGTQLTSRLIFKDLKVPVKEVNIGQGDAFVAIKEGKLDATVLISGKPSGAYSRLKSDPAYKLIPVPYAPVLQKYYLPAMLTHEDYPDLVAADRPISTIAVSSVLAVFNWAPNTDRYRRVAQFTEAFFAKFDKFLKKPRHPKWKEVNLAAELPGWTRFKAAQDILDREKNDNEGLRAAFERFITTVSPQDAATITPKRRDELFARFLEWQASQKKTQ